jgi:Cof subfamily protein (haloacid dehalogenase superfamily)
MRKSRWRLVVSDLDGTLVPYCTDSVSKLTVKMIANLRQAGIDFTIATGRSWGQAKPIINQLGISGPVLVQAGALVIDSADGRILRTVTLRPELEFQLRRFDRTGAVDQFCLSKEGNYYATRINTGGGDWLYRYGENCSLVEQWRHQPTDIIKHLFIGPESELRRLGETITAQISPLPRLIFWPPDPNQSCGDWFLEVFDPLASKGQALQWLVTRLGLEMGTVIAFGDGDNDLDMLQQAGMGVAIHGSTPEVLAMADCVAGRPETDGVARFLKNLDQPTGEAETSGL